MTIKKTKVVTFSLPKEYVAMVDFETLHPDWVREDSSSLAVTFKKEELYFVTKEK